MRKAVPLVAFIAALGLGLGLWLLVSAIARDDGGSPEGGGPGVGGGPQPFFQPRRVTPGIWLPPAAEPEAQERGMAAVAADAAKPRFTGTLNGFPVIDPSEQGQLPDPCAGQKVMIIEDDLEAMPF